MMDSKKVSELNNRSVKLTDAELSLVENFSVSLPMNELPEIIVVGAKSDLPDQDDQPVTIPFPATTPKKDSQSKEAVVESPSNSEVAKNASEQREPRKSNENSEIDLPEDELAIGANSESTVEAETDRTPDSDEVSFKIENYSLYTDRFDKVAKTIVKEMAGDSPNVVLVTSTGTGKSQLEIASSIISKIATRNPTMRIVSVQASPPSGMEEQYSIGLGHVISDEFPLEDAVIPSSIDNLDYLAYSEGTATIATTFKNRLGRMMDELKKHYDMVFVSSNSAAENETKAIAPLANATYLMLEMDAAESEVALKASECLRKCGATIAGCILTDSQ